MFTITKTEIEKKLKKHSLWLKNSDRGEEACFNDTIISDFDFSHTILRGVSFSNTKIIDCNFDYSELSYCMFEESNIIDCTFINSDLKRSDFQKANFENVDFSGSDFTSSNLLGAVFDKRCDLRSIILSCTKTDLVSFAGFGCQKRITVYSPSLDFIWCGCFSGSLDEFENAIRVRHVKGLLFNQYLGLVRFIKKHVRIKK